MSTNKQALRKKAEKAGGEEWQVRKDSFDGEYAVIVKGSLVKHRGWSTHRPVTGEVVDKKTADFIAAANPATMLALLDELEKDQAELQQRRAAMEKALNKLSTLKPGDHDGAWVLLGTLQVIISMDYSYGEAPQGA